MRLRLATGGLFWLLPEPVFSDQSTVFCKERGRSESWKQFGLALHCEDGGLLPVQRHTPTPMSATKIASTDGDKAFYVYPRMTPVRTVLNS